MDCLQAQEILLDIEINDPSLSGEERAMFFTHIEDCAVCRHDYERGQRLISLLREYGTIGFDTIELLESHGEVVPDHLRPELESSEEEVSEERIETGLARLMVQLDEIDVELKPPSEHIELVFTEKDVVDLPRPMSSLEVCQAPCHEQDDAATYSPIAEGSVESPVSQRAALWPHCSTRRWRLTAGLAAAACLAMAAVAWIVWQPTRSTVSSQQVAHQVGNSVEVITALGRWPLALGVPIRSEDSVLELLLGGRHKVVLNHGTTAAITVETIAGRDDSAWHVELPQGELYAEVVPGSRFAVATPNALATITGTKFNISARGNATQLTLLKGSVRFAAQAGEVSVDVTAGHASSVVGNLAPTRPRHVDALAATAWGRQRPLGSEQGLAKQSLHGLDLLGKMSAAALVPEVPDYRTWDYERFRDEQREWFAGQFPWAMQLEQVLNEQHGIEADYLDVLMISGDLWQFHYPKPRHTGGPIPAFHPAAVQRLARWYGLGSETMFEAIGRHHRAASWPENGHTGEAFATAIRRWRADLATVTGRDAAGDPILFSLRASTYLHHTRAAAYLWVREHPEQAERLLTSGDYASRFMAALLPSDQAEASFSPLNRLGKQLDASREGCRLAQQWLTASYYMRGCSTGSMPPPQQLRQRLLLLAPNEEEGQK